MPRVDAERVPDQLRCLREFASLQMHDAEQVEGIGVARLEDQCAMVAGCGGGDVSGLMASQTLPHHLGSGQSFMPEWPAGREGHAEVIADDGACSQWIG